MFSAVSQLQKQINELHKEIERLRKERHALAIENGTLRRALREIKRATTTAEVEYCPERDFDKCVFTPDLEYDPINPPINCEYCGRLKN